MTDPLRAVIYTRRLSSRHLHDGAHPARPDTDAHDALAAAVTSQQRVGPHRTVRDREARDVWSTLGPVALTLGVLSYAVLGFTRDPELRIGILGAVVAVAVAAPVFNRVAAGRSFDLKGIVLTGLGLKLLGVAARYDIIFSSYSGVGDAIHYHENGARVAEGYRSFNFDVSVEQKIPGTGFIRLVIGYIYAVVSPQIAFGFIVFGLFGFVGAWLLYRAFEMAVPEGNHRRYAILLFLWPSLLFWPSSLGKEAWIILGIGLTAYGGARILTHRRAGFAVAAAGVWAVTMTRPHITVLLFGAFAVAYAVRPSGPTSALGPVGKIIGLAVLFVAGGVILGASSEFLGLESFDRESIEATQDYTEQQSQQGGSGFEPPDPYNPIGYALAVVTVLVRPFPWEADNLQMLVTSLEGLVLGVLLVRATPQILRASTRVRSLPYVTMCISFLLAFAFAFASIGNFGILARQRTQVLPFVLVLVCLPPLLSRPQQLRSDDERSLRGRQRVEPARQRR